EAVRLAVAAQASGVRIRRGDRDRHGVAPGRVSIYVAEPGELGHDRAPKPIIGVARVALVLADVAVLEVRGGESIALYVFQISDERGHDVTGSAGRHRRRALEPVA